MIGERTLELGDDRVGEPGIAEHHQRVQRMREPAQVLLLLFRKLHRAIIGHYDAETFQEQLPLARRTCQ